MIIVEVLSNLFTKFFKEKLFKLLKIFEASTLEECWQRKESFQLLKACRSEMGLQGSLHTCCFPKGLHRWFDQLNLEKLDRAEVRSKYTDCTHKKWLSRSFFPVSINKYNDTNRLNIASFVNYKCISSLQFVNSKILQIKWILFLPKK